LSRQRKHHARIFRRERGQKRPGRLGGQGYSVPFHMREPFGG
jgi:hypothetical protein